MVCKSAHFYLDTNKTTLFAEFVYDSMLLTYNVAMRLLEGLLRKREGQ